MCRSFPLLPLVLCAIFAASCMEEQAPSLVGEEILDPEACASCHPDHYREWQQSMHAYTGIDPLFKALNDRAHRETEGEVGDYCVRCHSPMAVREGFTDTGLDLDDAPDHLKGVTCAFCHLTLIVPEDHNSSHVLATDEVMRGGIRDPVPTDAHRSEYGLLQDRNERGSSELCGSCHCVFTPTGVHVERTNREWKGTVFNSDGPARLTCGGCHMRGRDGVAAADPSLPERRLHDHSFPGVDTALIDFPGREIMEDLVQEELNRSLRATLCVGPISGGAEVVVRLENIGAGHSFPSGSAYDRRVWVELEAWEGDRLLLESGLAADDQPVSEVGDGAWVLRDRHYDAQGNELLFSWSTAHVRSELLPGPTTLDPNDPNYLHFRERSWPIYGALPDRVRMKVRIRATGLDVLDELIAGGDLDPALRDEMPTFDLENTELLWTGPVGSCVE